MKTKYLFLLSIAILICFLGCTSMNASFKAYDGRKHIKYYLKIPKGFKVRTVISDDPGIVKVYSYEDSSRIVFSDNINTPSFPRYAQDKSGNQLNLLFVTNKDNLDFNGIDPQGRYWRCRKIKYIIYSYFRVLPEKKEMFDNIMNNIIIKKSHH